MGVLGLLLSFRIRIILVIGKWGNLRDVFNMCLMVKGASCFRAFIGSPSGSVFKAVYNVADLSGGG